MTTTDTGRRPIISKEVDRMKNNTWQKLALAPSFGMPIYGPASCAAVAAHVRVDAIRMTGLFPGSHAWSPPIS